MMIVITSLLTSNTFSLYRLFEISLNIEIIGTKSHEYCDEGLKNILLLNSITISNIVFYKVALIYQNIIYRISKKH